MFQRWSLCLAFLLPVFGQEPPAEWTDASTGRRLIRLSTEPGSLSLYFHQNAYTASGDKMVIMTPRGLAVVHLASRKVEPLVEGRVSHVVVGKKTRQVFYIQEGTVKATHLDTRATREIVRMPELRTGSGLTVNADETLLAGSYVEGEVPRVAPVPGQSMLEARWQMRLPMALYTLDLETGKVNPFYRSQDWLNHVQFSPADPELLMFCHEGPWHKVDRIWTIRTDGSRLTKIHTRTSEMEIAGHEFWSPDGKVLLTRQTDFLQDNLAGFEFPSKKLALPFWVMPAAIHGMDWKGGQINNLITAYLLDSPA
ncbi:MAG: oligogalacturonate lyase family protein, partial [Bryobacteraceae bacterium]|nr:oligogalacturonate lyase family protein [Bryobacteraceae bacterium]